MNVNQIIRMAMRLFRPLIGRGINAGIDRVAGKGKPAAEMTPEERKQAASGKQMAKRAQKLGRMARRFGRF